MLSATNGVPIQGLSFDSRSTKAGDVFFALRGRNVDGRHYVGEAIKAGAVLIVAEEMEEAELVVPVIRVDSCPVALSEVSAKFFGSGLDERISIAVTGTNGKTSVAFLLAQALAILCGRACYAGTLGLGALSRGQREISFSATLTTSPDPISFHKFVAENSGPVVAELSSISLHQRRLEALELDQAIFTNLTRDHLDYHGTMEEYLECKRLLFSRDLSASVKTTKSAILNLDDVYSRSTQFPGGAYFYSTQSKEAECYVESTELTAQGSKITFAFGSSTVTVDTELIGRYNVENLAAVCLSLHQLGYCLADIKRAVSSLRAVPGRLERVFVSPELPTAVVDYAHSPDALEKAILSLRELTGGRLITVFGCGGDRDRGKRPLMGEIASRLSEQVVVTSDNPRTEDPEEILREISSGISDGASALFVSDRRAAIKEALRQAGSSDVVLIAGKGHEPYQEIAGVRYPFSDVEEARHVLRERRQGER